MKNNPVFQVLVVSNSQMFGDGNNLEDLAVGQLGIFDAATNESVDISGTIPDKFFFAVGLPDVDGNLGDVRKSAGEYISKSLINNIQTSDPVDASSQVIEIDMDGFVPAANKDYVIRLTFMSANTMGMQGFNHPAKSFVVHIGATAPNLSDFIDLCVDEINNDDEGVVTASADSDVLVLTIGADDKIATVGGLNPKYHFLRQMKATLSLGGDWSADQFEISSTGPVYAEGLGYDVRQLEYVAGGWIGNPGVYRESELTAMIGYPIEIYAVAGTKYWLMRLNYEFKSHSGGNLPYSNQLETVIAVPNTSEYNQFITDLFDNEFTDYPGVFVHVTTSTTTTAEVTTTTTTAAPVTTTTTTGS